MELNDVIVNQPVVIDNVNTTEYNEMFPFIFRRRSKFFLKNHNKINKISIFNYLETNH